MWRWVRARLPEAVAVVRRVGFTTFLVVALWTFSGLGPLLPKLITINVSIPTIAFLMELVKFIGCLLWLWLYPLAHNAWFESRGYQPALLHRDAPASPVEPPVESVHVDRYGDVVTVVAPQSPKSPENASSGAVADDFELGTPSKPLYKTFQPVRRKDLLEGFGWQSAWRFAIIAALYVAVNNLKLYAQIALDPGTYTLLNNISILTTAFLYRIVMRRRLTNYQYVALLLLVTGLFTSKMTIVLGASHHQAVIDASTTAPAGAGEASFATGLIVMIIASLSSSSADVGIEYAFKEFRHHHFVAQSLSLYLFGVLFNGIMICIVNWQTLAEEYATILNMDAEWLLVFTYAFNGVLIGLVLRYLLSGNLTKMFVDAGALLETLVAETLFLHIVPGIDLLVGVVTIYCGIYLWMSEADACDKLNGTVHGH